MHDVRLAEPDAAVYEQRIIYLARLFRHSLRRGVRQTVAAADDEILEVVFGIERARLEYPRRSFLRTCRRHFYVYAVRRRISVLLRHERNIGRRALHLAQCAAQQRHVLCGDLGLGLSRRRIEHQNVAVDLNGSKRRYPYIEAERVYLDLEYIAHFLPNGVFVFHKLIVIIQYSAD